MSQPQRIKQSTSLYQRLNEEAQRRRREAKSAQPGIERERHLRKARQAETASQIDEWLSQRFDGCHWFDGGFSRPTQSSKTVIVDRDNPPLRRSGDRLRA